jgi:ketosteroid isomerase-like protein
MRKTFVTLLLALVAVVPNAVAQQADVLAVVRQFVDGFNKGDIQSALATCAEETSIIDEIPPYAWHGPGACGKWASDYDADAKKRGITDGVVTLGATKHTYVTGDRAYVVVPAGYEVKQNGKPVKQTGSTMTVVLGKGATGWKIVAWTWSTN